jgi:hypothetical protein
MDLEELLSTKAQGFLLVTIEGQVEYKTHSKKKTNASRLIQL